MLPLTSDTDDTLDFEREEPTRPIPYVPIGREADRQRALHAEPAPVVSRTAVTRDIRPRVVRDAMARASWERETQQIEHVTLAEIAAKAVRP